MMKRLSLGFLIAVGGCAEPSPLRPNCAVRPADFRTFTNPKWNDGAIPIEPPLITKIALARNGRRITWNGVRLGGTIEDGEGWAMLASYLDQSGELEPMPYATLLFDRGTSCEAVERARKMMRRGLHCSDSRRCFQGAAPY